MSLLPYISTECYLQQYIRFDLIYQKTTTTNKDVSVPLNIIIMVSALRTTKEIGTSTTAPTTTTTTAPTTITTKTAITTKTPTQQRQQQQEQQRRQPRQQRRRQR